jgi:hypothetical protein
LRSTLFTGFSGEGKLPNKNKPRVFFVNNPDELNLQFYSGYDTAFIFRKVGILNSIVENIENYRTLLVESFGEEYDEKKTLNAIKAEIHFSEFHQFEAFFALLISIYQDLPHWLYLSNYTNSEIFEKVKAFLKHDFLSVSNGRANNAQEFINLAVFNGYVITDDTQGKTWQDNIDNIIWMLTRLSDKYLEGKEYNSYKHGVRVILSPSAISFTPNGNPEGGFQISHENSIRYLATKELEVNKYEVRQVFKDFNPIESVNNINFMNGALETIVAVRLARIKGDCEPKFNFLPYLDKEKVIALSKSSYWSMTL